MTNLKLGIFLKSTGWIIGLLIGAIFLVFVFCCLASARSKEKDSRKRGFMDNNTDMSALMLAS